MKPLALVLVLVLAVALVAPAAAQLPPTPTPLPPGTAVFTLPNAFSLWGGAQQAVQVWNMAGPWQPVIQGIAIIGLVITGMFVVYRFIRQMTSKDTEE
jgi:hypothetical protein